MRYRVLRSKLRMPCKHPRSMSTWNRAGGGRLTANINGLELQFAVHLAVSGFGLLDSGAGEVDSHCIKALLGKPVGMLPATTADVQYGCAGLELPAFNCLPYLSRNRLYHPDRGGILFRPEAVPPLRSPAVCPRWPKVVSQDFSRATPQASKQLYGDTHFAAVSRRNPICRGIIPRVDPMDRWLSILARHARKPVPPRHAWFSIPASRTSILPVRRPDPGLKHRAVSNHRDDLGALRTAEPLLPAVHRLQRIAENREVIAGSQVTVTQS